MLIDTKELENLVEFEQSVSNIDIEKPIQVKFISGRIKLTTHDGIELYGAIDRPLIHQIGSRAWGANLEFEKINEIWKNKSRINQTELESELASVFRKNDLSVRYYTDNNGKNNIYGIVTPYFLDVNQFDFRQVFLETIRKNKDLNPVSLGIQKNNYGKVTEIFQFYNKGFQTNFEYILNYAENNGYDSYKVIWGREIVICTNGLTAWDKATKSNWRHTREIELEKFVSNSVNEGIGNQEFLEKRIELSKDTSLTKSSISELIERLSLAQASKDRVLNRLAIESNVVGNNEWALSQALTWLGTYEKALPFSVKPQVTGLGTEVLEESLDTLMNKQPRKDSRGRYGLILPRELESTV